MKEQKLSSQEICQEKGLPHELRLEGLEPAVGRDQGEGWKSAVNESLC